MRLAYATGNVLTPQHRPSGNDITEMVLTEKEPSDWLPSGSEFSYADRKDGPLGLQRTFERGKVFQF